MESVNLRRGQNTRRILVRQNGKKKINIFFVHQINDYDYKTAYKLINLVR